MALEIGRRASSWLARWGFAVLIGAGATVAVAVAYSVDPPADVPSFALQATPVYRLEVGASFFAAAYLASLAFVLALNNRAFTEIGASGLKAQDIGSTDQKVAIRDQGTTLKELTRMVERLHRDLARDDSSEE